MGGARQRAPAPPAARLHAGLCPSGDRHPAGPLGHAGGAGRGLRADGAGQRPAAAPGHRPCAQERADPLGHAAGTRLRRSALWGGADRDRLRLAGHGQLCRAGDPVAGFPCDHGLHRRRLGRLRADQPRRRPRLHVPRPADPRHRLMATLLVERAATETVPAEVGQAAQAWYQLRRSPLALIGLAILLLVLFTMVTAPWIAPFDPYAINLRQRLLPPGPVHWFGTDEVGRDLFSRVLYGSRASCGTGFAIVGIAASIGTVVGCLSGLVGRRADTVIMRLMDVVLALPSLVLSIALAAALGPSLFNAMLAVAFVRIPFYVRLARGQALSLRERNYVKVARTFGASPGYILFRHILPNALAPIIVQA